MCVLVSNNYESHQKAILFSDFGSRLYNEIKIQKFKKFIQTGLGTKYRIHFLAAKVADGKIKKIEKNESLIEKIFQYFINKIKNSKLLIPPKNLKDFKRGGFTDLR